MFPKQSISIVDADIYQKFLIMRENFSHLKGEELVRKISSSGLFRTEDMVCTSSFGVDAPIMLHIISNVNRHIPIAFLDTQRHFNDTLLYKDFLVSTLQLKNVREYYPNQEAIQKLEKNKQGELYGNWLMASQENKDTCCKVRKHEPQARALKGKTLWFTGRKNNGDINRDDLPLFEIEDNRIIVNPIASYKDSDIELFFKETKLLRHPLYDQGYESIACIDPCTKTGEGREGRVQRYCGMHKLDR